MSNSESLFAETLYYWDICRHVVFAEEKDALVVYGMASRADLIYFGRKLEVCFASSPQSANAYGAHVEPSKPEPELQSQPVFHLCKLFIPNVHLETQKVSTVMLEKCSLLRAFSGISNWLQLRQQL